MNNVLVTGANGQLGSELKEITNNSTNFYFTNSQELDITNRKSVEEFVIDNRIKTIINCAAYTAVDAAEQDFYNCNLVNHLAVENIALVAKNHSVNLIHVSTDYVFDGNNHKPYNELDKTNPKSVYGKTKLAGELAMLKINPYNSIIIRTSWVYSSFGNNFVKTMLKLGENRKELGVIFDQIGSPTYARDLANIIIDVSPKIINKEVEIFHYTNEGICSWYDFSKEIFSIEKTLIKVNPIGSIDYPTPAKRPYYSVLNKTKIKDKFNLSIPHWKDSLKECLNKLKNR